MRLIDADALIEGANEALGRFKAEKTVQMLRFHKSMIEDAPTIERLDWTPCADGLPTESTERCTEYTVTVRLKSNSKLIFPYVATCPCGTWNDIITGDALDEDWEVIAWKIDAPYRADETTGKVKED